MRRVDIATGVFFIALGLFAIIQSLELDFVSRGGGPGPGVYPLLLAVALTGLGGALITSRLRGTPEEFGRFNAPAAPELKRVVLVMAAVAGSIALLPVAGYFLSTLALVAVLLFGVERLRSWPAIVTTLALPAIFFFLFVVLLRVRLPSGFVDL